MSASLASRQAIADSGLVFEGESAERTACLIGSGVGYNQAGAAFRMTEDLPR